MALTERATGRAPSRAPALNKTQSSIEVATLEITQNINLLRLATKEELEAVVTRTKTMKGEESAGRFLLKIFSERREIQEKDLQAEIDARNLRAEREGKNPWTSTPKMLRANANCASGTKTENTGLELIVAKKDGRITWRWESRRVQEADEIPRHKRISYKTASTTRHAKVLETALRTTDKRTKCLLRLLAGQTAGVRLVEIESVFKGTLNQANLLEFIEEINNEILADLNAKIHIRNGIAIIAPANPHWKSKTGEPILIDKAEAVAQFVKRHQEETTNQIRLALKNKAGQTEALTAENAELRRSLTKAIKDIEEALTEAESARTEAEKAEAEKAVALAATTPEAIEARIAEAVSSKTAELTARLAVAEAGVEQKITISTTELTAQLAAAEAEVKRLEELLYLAQRDAANQRTLRTEAEDLAKRAEDARLASKRAMERFT